MVEKSWKVDKYVNGRQDEMWRLEFIMDHIENVCAMFHCKHYKGKEEYVDSEKGYKKGKIFVLFFKLGCNKYIIKKNPAYGRH